MSQVVVALALLGVGQHVLRGADELEALCGVGVVADVRVVLFDLLSVGAPDVGLARVVGNVEEFVELL